MRKKLLTVALAATMVVSSVFSAFAETLTGTAWWTGSQAGQDYALKGNGSITLTIETKEDTGAFSVELYNAGTAAANDGYYFTTGSDGNVWFAELAAEGSELTSNPFGENNNGDPGKFVAGHTYEITVTRSGNDYTISYYDTNDATEIYKMAGTAAVEFPEELNVHVIAQVGEITVNQKNQTTPDHTVASTDDQKDDTTTTTTTAAADNDNNVTPSKTGDTTAVAVVAIVALGAAVAVVVSKKKVTE